MNITEKSIELAGRTLTIQTGRMAKQADGAVTVQYGNTMILTTAVSEREPTHLPYFPLMVEYREKGYAAGKVPGGFFKREGRPSDHEVISARLTDRPIRPLFPDDYMYDTQVMISVISADQESLADVLAPVGASTALTISDIPFDGPIASVRVGRVDGEIVINPTLDQLEESDMNFVVAGNEENVQMVEGEAGEISEDEFIQAMEVAQENILKIIQLQNELKELVGKPTRDYEGIVLDSDVRSAIEGLIDSHRIMEIVTEPLKQRRNGLRSALVSEVKEQLPEEYEEHAGEVRDIVEDLMKKQMRARLLDDNLRIDGRKPADIRDVACEVGLLPRAHGSSLFTRGETQSLCGITLGTKMDEQTVDDLTQEYSKSFMLHYNFPPFSVGEVKPIRGVSRREQGHGYLAERAIQPVIPSAEEFAYTVRVVSDILESNGSSSMATVCSGSLALMDAGVPISNQVSGIAMGLVKDGDRYAVLSDILGEEDFYGDMDLKVAGTRNGITAIQMDLKISGLPMEIMQEALEQARTGREHIRGVMDTVIHEPREQTSEFAPKIVSYTIPQKMIGQLIGPGGKNVKKIQEETGANIEIDDDGTVFISADNREDGERALEMAQRYTAMPEEGKVYEGLVKRIEDYGAFVEILPGKEGLLHISNLQKKRTNKVTDILSVGDKVKVKLMEIDDRGRYDLSRKAVLDEEEE